MPAQKVALSPNRQRTPNMPSLLLPGALAVAALVPGPLSTPTAPAGPEGRALPSAVADRDRLVALDLLGGHFALPHENPGLLGLAARRGGAAALIRDRAGPIPTLGEPPFGPPAGDRAVSGMAEAPIWGPGFLDGPRSTFAPLTSAADEDLETVAPVTAGQPQPTPEPGGLTLLALGAALVGLRRRRRK
jgi:hypothetical protein